jgi:hypothetical protein
LEFVSSIRKKLDVAGNDYEIALGRRINNINNTAKEEEEEQYRILLWFT